MLVNGSLFDPEFATQLERASFLGRLARRIRMPVMPDDEATDYLVTQVMADFLADRLDPPLDGIAYAPLVRYRLCSSGDRLFEITAGMPRSSQRHRRQVLGCTGRALRKTGCARSG